MSDNQFDLYKYIAPKSGRSVIEIVLSFILVLAGFSLFYVAIRNNIWPLYLLIFPLAFFYTRLFVLQHDLGHGNLFKENKYNDIFGTIIGIILMTPYYYWRKAHAIHHASGGNKDKRPWLGDIELLSVEEYKTKSRWEKFRYRAYRNPLVMFFIGSIYVFVIDQRFYHKHKGFGKKEKWSVIITNIAILALYGPLIILLGLKFFLLAMFLPQWVGGSIGIYLFYVQHNFKNRYFVSAQQWTLKDSALRGSTFYDLPKALHWLTANIGYHHIHTLVPRIPFYNLPQCHKENNFFDSAPKVYLKQLPELISLKLYDEDKQQMITWKEYNLALEMETANQQN